MQTLDRSSYWIDSASLPRFPKLERNLAVDVVVIGAGITGITAAYLLKKAGRSVALVDRARCAAMDTGHTTAHVTAVTDLRLQDIARNFGRDHARAVWDAGAAAIDRIVANIRAEDIACDFKWIPGYLHAPLSGATDRDRSMLEAEASLARELGLQADYVPEVPFVKLPGVKFAHQALFHPRKYLSSLLHLIPGGGSHVFESTEIDEVQADPLAVTAGPFKITCDYLVVATHTPLTGKAGTLGAMLFQTKFALYSTYALGARIPSGLIPEASFWDTSNPYYYLRVDHRRGSDYAIFGGEDHKTGQGDGADAAFRRLEQRFREIVPDAHIDHQWSGQVIETNDGLPFIGEVVDRQFAATGFAGNGMTFGTLAGLMAVDAALGRRNPWRDLFAPGRKKLLGGTWDYLKENKDYPYYLVRDWLGRADTDSLAAVPRQQGRIVSLDGRKVAAYRDAAGQLTLCSPVCTHLKCIVAWNDAEQTWDCPCHGSRFRPTGEVISGPAEEPLEKLPPPK